MRYVMPHVVIAALYQFRAVENPAGLQSSLKSFCADREIRGTLIVAGEGINGTVSGSREAITALHERLVEDGFTRMEYKESLADDHPFRKLKIKLKAGDRHARGPGQSPGPGRHLPRSAGSGTS
jgi:UPF0176 protein